MQYNDIDIDRPNDQTSFKAPASKSISENVTKNFLTEHPQPPRDLPSPRHRPGEPILYDPPVGDSKQPYPPYNDPLTHPYTGEPMIFDEQ